MLGRLLGWLFLGVALVCLGADAMAMLERGAATLLPLRQLWAALAPQSLAAAQAGLAGTAAFLWDPVAVTVLAVPGVILFGVIGLALLLLFRRREPRIRRFASSR